MKKRLLLVLLSLVFLAGCATVQVKLQPVAGAPQVDFSRYDTLMLQLSVAEGVKMDKEDLDRMSNKIIEVLQKQYIGRFQVVTNDGNNSGTSSNELSLEVQFTKFKKAVFIVTGFLPPEIKADILLKRGNTPVATGSVRAYGERTLYGGDLTPTLNPIEAWGKILNPQKWTERIFVEKLAESLAI